MPGKVSGQHAERVVAVSIRDTGCLRNIGESAIAVVSVQNVPIEWQTPRAAIHRDAAVIAVRISTGFGSDRRVELHIIRDEKIEMPITVNVRKCTASVVSHSTLGQVSGGSDVFKVFAPKVPIEMIL